jgi:hypothetical protein
MLTLHMACVVMQHVEHTGRTKRGFAFLVDKLERFSSRYCVEVTETRSLRVQ